MSHKIYLPSRWKNGAESIGIETTGYLWPNLTLCLFIPCQNFACASSTELYGVLLLNKPCRQSHQYQGRTSGRMLFLLACIHPVTSCRAGWSYVIHGRLEFHPSMSWGSSMQAALCIQARIMHAHLFYLGIDDFALSDLCNHMLKCSGIEAFPTRCALWPVQTDRVQRSEIEYFPTCCVFCMRKNGACYCV